jgi:hypothetical protein
LGGSIVTVTVTPTPTRPAGRRGRGPLLLGGAAFSVGGAAVYLAVLPAHLQANPVAGILFKLSVDGLVLRYRADQTDDGLTGAEGTFTFALINAVIHVIRAEDPRADLQFVPSRHPQR